MAKFSRFLVVCTGNICRSPIGEVMLRDSLAGRPGLVVQSAGIAAVVGAPAHEYSVAAMAEAGMDLSGHVARQLEAQHIRDFDLLLVMESGQKEWIERRLPQARGRVYRLGHWLECDVPDPIGRPVEAFRDTRELVQRAIETWLVKLPR